MVISSVPQISLWISGWQKHAIEFVLKKALFPHNLLAVRKIAIRLFLLWYQSLAIYNNATAQLDSVFQSLLPHFPLRNGLSTETILQNYCQAVGTVGAPGPMRNSPLINNPNNTLPTVKEKAQLLQMAEVAVEMFARKAKSADVTTSLQRFADLHRDCASRAKHLKLALDALCVQVYLDKFLEYCTRETVRLEWSDESRRLDCAKFIVDRVIVLYIYETFPDIETNGVDIYGGWEGTEEHSDIRDTADPIVIARYWLIRWMTTIASSSENEVLSSGQLLYKQALFSSRKATNTLLTLLKEAVLLPLPCSNVIHKVFALIRSWLLQHEVAPFVADSSVSMESLSLLLIHFLTSFFHSPYLTTCGDRLSSAIALTQSFLQTARDLSNPTSPLPQPLSPRVWCELIKSLADGIRVVTCRSDAYGRATSGALAQNLLVVFVFVRAIRGIEIEERIWDDVLLVFQSGCWVQMIEQWGRVVDIVTRALILNVFEVDIAPAGTLQSPSAPNVRRERSEEMNQAEDSASVEIGSEESRSETETSVEDENAQINSVVQSAGDSTVWLRVWMRIVNLVSPLHVAHSQLAIQTVSRTITTLLRVSGTDALVHWICARLLLLPPGAQAHCVPAFCRCVDEGGSLERDEVSRSAGDSTVWLRVWMRIVNLVSPLHVAHSQLAIQTVSRTITTLLRVSGTDALVHWICARLLLLPPGAQAHCVPAFCAVLSSSSPPTLVQAHILIALTRALTSEQCGAVLENMPSMSHEHLSALAKPTLVALSQLVKQFNYSPRSIQVAALLAPDHSAAETLLLNLISSNSPEITLQSHALALNALALLVIERGDTTLMLDVLGRVRNLRGASRLLHLFCSDLNQLARLSRSNKLIELLERTLELVNEECWAGELLWQSVSLSLSEQRPRRSLLDRVVHDKRACLEGMLLVYANQFPLTSFSLAQCNSIEYPAKGGQHKNSDQLTAGHVFIDQKSAILSVDHEDGLRVTCRTAVGKHCWRFEDERETSRHSANVNKWLRKLATKPRRVVRKQSTTRIPTADPFQGLPQLSRTLETEPIECSDMYSFIQQNRRVLVELSNKQQSLLDEQQLPQTHIDENSSLWRSLVSDFRLISGTRKMPLNFARDLRHLDQTLSREVHKVAVIYVAKGQEDKNMILANGAGSESFETFVSGLGWLVQIGRRHHGYNGGLSGETLAPYYASGDTEIIFHVSTMLGGDVTQKLKHLGNDEVHVVWSEHDRPYRRDTIATRFCDVLLVLYQISALLVRVHIETQRPLEFGPLFDGAHVHVKQLPHLVRDTVLNASRAYRIAQQDCARPLQHREKVFLDSRQQLVELSAASSISQVYMPSLKW
ncbi:Ral GTPase-activating protein subunit alpha-1 [Toxocara canis]|uniref:Ral GTPase-activating protein subunit alpha-1 n=1 Tax=Toxocara canis TaxID=6265 RepID=A0A0B2V343_TOXCA|nr:Ral GTPase-activating protein subunit alpha-1 [Toxocara canis]